VLNLQLNSAKTRYLSVQTKRHEAQNPTPGPSRLSMKRGPAAISTVSAHYTEIILPVKTGIVKHISTDLPGFCSLPPHVEWKTRSLHLFCILHFEFCMQKTSGFHPRFLCDLCDYSLGPASTRALPSSLPVYFSKFLMNRADRSLAFSSHTEGSA